jgi:deoxyribodipyrimidine photo-lyase
VPGTQLRGAGTDAHPVGRVAEVTVLPTPELAEAGAWVDRHLSHVVRDGSVGGRPARVGGQAAADRALAELDISGYARRRSMVDPPSKRGASVLSPYIRHGLLTLAEVRAAIATAPAADRRRYVDELLWQEYCRHLYARAGDATRQPLRREPAVGQPAWDTPLPRDMACLRYVVDELEDTGWIVNQTRMWVASQWTVRAGHDWRLGEDWMFAHLLDGSRAANRFGWQWTIGALTSKPYGFSRWQVRRRAPSLCETCRHRDACPIEGRPPATSGRRLDGSLLREGPANGGPEEPTGGGSPEAIWLTAESLGDRDPAAAAWPDLPVVFVFDEPLLAGLRLARGRLVFLAETLADLARRRPVEIRLGRPADELGGTRLAVTHAPVPGYRRLATTLDIVDEHPFPWLARPDGGDVSSYSVWIRRARKAAG